MMKLLAAAFAILAASCISSGAFAVPAVSQTGAQASGNAIQVHYRHTRHCRHGRRLTLSHYRLCHYPYPTSASCGCYTLWPF
jgi:hypothetical protein